MILRASHKEKLRLYLVANGIPVSKVARNAGLSVPYVSAVLREKKACSKSSLRRICEAAGLTWDALEETWEIEIDHTTMVRLKPSKPRQQNRISAEVVQRIDHYMRARNLSRVRLLDRMGDEIAYNTVVNSLSGRCSMSQRTYKAICEALGVDEEFFKQPEETL